MSTMDWRVMRFMAGRPIRSILQEPKEALTHNRNRIRQKLGAVEITKA